MCIKFNNDNVSQMEMLATVRPIIEHSLLAKIVTGNPWKSMWHHDSGPDWAPGVLAVDEPGLITEGDSRYERGWHAYRMHISESLCRSVAQTSNEQLHVVPVIISELTAYDADVHPLGPRVAGKIIYVLTQQELDKYAQDGSLPKIVKAEDGTYSVVSNVEE